MMNKSVKNRRVDRISMLLQEYNIEKLFILKGSGTVLLIIYLVIQYNLRLKKYLKKIRVLVHCLLRNRWLRRLFRLIKIRF